MNSLLHGRFDGFDDPKCHKKQLYQLWICLEAKGRKRSAGSLQKLLMTGRRRRPFVRTELRRGSLENSPKNKQQVSSCGTSALFRRGQVSSRVRLTTGGGSLPKTLSINSGFSSPSPNLSFLFFFLPAPFPFAFTKSIHLENPSSKLLRSTFPLDGVKVLLVEVGEVSRGLRGRCRWGGVEGGEPEGSGS